MKNKHLLVERIVMNISTPVLTNVIDKVTVKI
jgi:hypothetical protein